VCAAAGRKEFFLLVGFLQGQGVGGGGERSCAASSLPRPPQFLLEKLLTTEHTSRGLTPPPLRRSHRPISLQSVRDRAHHPTQACCACRWPPHRRNARVRRAERYAGRLPIADRVSVARLSRSWALRAGRLVVAAATRKAIVLALGMFQVPSVAASGDQDCIGASVPRPPHLRRRRGEPPCRASPSKNLRLSRSSPPKARSCRR